MNKNEVTPVQIAIRIVIIIIVIVALLLVSFAMVRFVPRVLSSLSNFRNIFAGREKITLDLDKDSVAQGEEAILTYRQTGGKKEGYYELTYSCSKIDSDTHLEVTNENDKDVVLCDDAFYLGEATESPLENKVSVRTTGESVSYEQPVSITVKHVHASSTTPVTSSITLNVRGDNNVNDDNGENDVIATSTRIIPTPSTTSRPAATRTVQTTYSSVPADLVVTSSKVNVDANGRATLTFNVTNIGGQNTGAWRFYAELPREVGATTFSSASQPSIPPQGTSVMYLVFDNATAGNINVYLDHSNNIRENNENNNTLTAELR